MKIGYNFMRLITHYEEEGGVDSLEKKRNLFHPALKHIKSDMR